MEKIKETPEELVLRNRYNNKIVLRKTGADWTLVSDAYYHRLILNDDSSIHALDPEGGPFMCVGGQIDDYTIKSIKELNGEYIFTLDNGIHN